MSLRFLLPLTILGAVACSSTPSTGAGSPSADSGSPQPDASNGDAEAPRDASADDGRVVHDAADAGHVKTGDATTAAILHECTDDRFVDRSGGADGSRTIMATRNNSYDPPCMVIRAGQSVMFTGSFTSHPLAPGVAPGQSGAGTTASPIEMRSAGTAYSVTFPTAGDYPFYCTYHAGGGMYGVVRVMP